LDEVIVYQSPGSGRFGYAALSVAVFLFPIFVLFMLPHEISPAGYIAVIGVMLVASVTLYVILCNIVQELRIDPAERKYEYRFLTFSAPIEGSFDDLEKLSVDWRPGLRESGSYHLYLHWKEHRSLEVMLPDHTDGKAIYQEGERLAEAIGLPPPDRVDGIPNPGRARAATKE
jgi:hypothetical protein